MAWTAELEELGPRDLTRSRRRRREPAWIVSRRVLEEAVLALHGADSDRRRRLADRLEARIEDEGVELDADPGTCD